MKTTSFTQVLTLAGCLSAVAMAAPGNLQERQETSSTVSSAPAKFTLRSNSLNATRSSEDAASRIAPAGSWDTHHHVYDIDVGQDPRPLLQFQMWEGRKFTPAPAPLSSYIDMMHKIGIDYEGLAHSLTFGEDQISLEYYYEYFQGKARSFGIIQPENVTDEEITRLHAKGVRGVRIDYTAYEANTDPALQAQLMLLHADRIKAFGWKPEIYHTHPEYWPEHVETVKNLSTELVADHFAGLRTKSLANYIQRKANETESEFDLTTQPGYAAVIELLQSGKLWVKLSAPYRVSEAQGYTDMQPLVRALVEANPDRVVYGSDWPHPQPFHRRVPNLSIEDLEEGVDFDDAAWVALLKEWLSVEEWTKLMITNPRAYYGITEEEGF